MFLNIIPQFWPINHLFDLRGSWRDKSRPPGLVWPHLSFTWRVDHVFKAPLMGIYIFFVLFSLWKLSGLVPLRVGPVSRYYPLLLPPRLSFSTPVRWAPQSGVASRLRTIISFYTPATLRLWKFSVNCRRKPMLKNFIFAKSSAFICSCDAC